MCRIFGFVSTGTDRLDQLMARVSRLQVHGGPDAQNSIAKSDYGIGANRLALTDPTGGAQPYSKIPGIHAVLNGEIYNHAELRAGLEADGYRFDDRCDGSILPALYAKYGAGFAEHIDGMFAAAILDLRFGAPLLVLAADSAGMKPLYYAARGGSFAFASEIPALLQFGLASGAMWREGLDQYLTLRAVAAPRTLLEDVYSLPPGTVMQVRAGEEPKISTFTPRARYDGPLPKTVAEAGDILRELLAQEVARLGKADANLCSINSGGLDSGLVTALLRRTTSEKTTAFHVACKGDWPFDERGYARELAKFCDLDYREVLVDPAEIPDLLPKVVQHLGQPNGAPHTISTYKMFSAISAAGFRVALTGEGADELFCGHRRMHAAIRDEGSDWASAYIDSIGPAPEAARWKLYSRDCAAGLKRPGAAAKDGLAGIIRAMGLPRSKAVRRFEQRYSLPDYILRRAEPLAMASAVELRVPFCQPRIVDFSWQVDPALFEGGKAIVYAAAEGLVPRSILSRPKQPFTLPVCTLMHKGSPLMGFVRDTLLSPRRFDDGIFDRAAIESLVHAQEKAPGRDSAYTLWALAVYGLWTDMIASHIPAGMTAQPEQIQKERVRT